MAVVTTGLLNRDLDYAIGEEIFQATLVFGSDTVIGTISEKLSRYEVEGGVAAGQKDFADLEWTGKIADFAGTLPTQKNVVALTVANLGLSSAPYHVQMAERSQDGLVLTLDLEAWSKA